ncbi:MAG: FtsX-like permease family protein [Gemmatimonas sp.]|nr:FtsX-like permease family protein [Gemmatimonas sp.]
MGNPLCHGVNRRSMPTFAADFRLALRALRHTTGFAATVVFILGLGIGMATAVFTVYHAVLLRELPVRDQGELVVLWGEVPGQVENVGMPYPTYLEFRDGNRSLQNAAAVLHNVLDRQLLLRDGDVVAPIQGSYVTGNYFQTLGTRPFLGRFIQPEDDVVGAEPALVLSYATWQQFFGGDPDVVGRPLTLSGTTFTLRIVGVAPPGLGYPAGTDAWLPLLAGVPPAVSDSTGRAVPLNVVGRLAPNGTPAQARAEFLTALHTVPSRGLPEGQLQATAEPLTEVVLGDARPALIALGIAVALLLLIACANVGNLLLVRAGGRTHEMAIRRALGAGSGQVVRHLLAESLVLGLMGGAVGLLLANGLIRVLLTFAPPELPRLDTIQLGVVPTIIAVGGTLVSTAIFGLAPALWSARHDLASPLRASPRGGGGGRRARLVRNVLVVWQVALAVVILAGAGLLVRSLNNLQRLDPGYRPEGLAIARMDFPWSAYGTLEERKDLLDQFVTRVEAVPGAVAATPVYQMPFSEGGGPLHSIVAEDPVDADLREGLILAVEIAGPHYFQTFGLPILRGRAFTDADREDALPVVIISEAAARRLWPGQDPIGKRLRWNALEYQDDWKTVVGIAPDTRYRDFRTEEPSIYYPYRQYNPSAILAVRTTGPPAAMLSSIRSALAEIDPQLGIWRFDTMDDLLGEPLAQPRLNTILLSAFAIAALILAVIGLYAVTATAVRQQTRELGIRVALGAAPGNVRRLVLGQAFSVVGIGAASGLIAALATSRVLRSMLFQISPTDPATLVGVSALLLVVALVAADLPARRAARVDPVHVLRAE